MNKRSICKGYSNAVISISHLAINSKVYVIDGKAESSLGGDSSFKLEILAQVNSVGQTIELDSLLQEYDYVFRGIR